MKVLTIREPYASLIKNNIKKIETRSWKTNYRGELYIHAGLGKDKVKKELLDIVNEYNYGQIICKCNLVDCVYMDEDFIKKIKQNNIEYISGEYKVGRYAWILDNIQELDNYIPAKGKLSIWNYNEKDSR